MYGWNKKGSKWDSNEDDWWEGSEPEYNTPEEAKTALMEAAKREILTGNSGYPLWGSIFQGEINHKAEVSGDIIAIEEFCLVEGNEALREADRRADRQEYAMQAGMAFGCDGYNDAMGYGSDDRGDW
ncbi:MAG: hypothetical protein OEY01_03430 [Desulfobulbaceae bacterium]|nr:hypothetical protein [Desulfobulbaceae bacterium]